MILADRIVILDKGEIAQAGSPEEVYNRPVSAFVANFMGATNALVLDAAALPRGVAEGRGAFAVHFRSESASLAPADASDPEALMLAGTVSQISYPGGVWRYAVDVGARRLLVDSRDRLPIGAAVRVRVPRETLHVFAAETATHTQQAAASVAA